MEASHMIAFPKQNANQASLQGGRRENSSKPVCASTHTHTNDACVLGTPFSPIPCRVASNRATQQHPSYWLGSVSGSKRRDTVLCGRRAGSHRRASATSAHPPFAHPPALPPRQRHQYPRQPPPAAMKRACLVHDAVNLVLLPFLCALTVAGVLQWIAPEVVTSVFLAYVATDTLWVWAQVRL